MKQYIKSKKVKAKPMNRGEWCEYRGIIMSVYENPLAAGYFIEYQNCKKINDSRHDGFIEWIPENEFNLQYTELDGG